jgi:SAM-dependent methyltransferase
MSNIICQICSNEDDNQTYQVREMMFGFRDTFTYFECSSCGCLQISEIPDNISKYYPSNYYSLQEKPSTFSIDFMRILVEQFLRRRRTAYAVSKRGIIGRLMYTLFPNGTAQSLSKINLTRDSWILDVGCGSGELLYYLRQMGFKNLLGIDAFIKRDILYANGLRIRKGSLQNVDGKWDLIMFNASFEHMPNQLATLQVVSSLLTYNGLCLVNIPTVSSYAWKTYGVNWVQLDAPRHYFLHSIRSLRLLAEKASLELKGIFFNSTSFQFWGSEQYVKDIPLCSAQVSTEKLLHTIISGLQHRKFEQKARELNQINQGDSATFYMVKKKL